MLELADFVRDTKFNKYEELTLNNSQNPVDGEVIFFSIAIFCRVPLLQIQEERIFSPEGQPVVGEHAGGMIARKDEENEETSDDADSLTILCEYGPLHLQNKDKHVKVKDNYQ